MRHYRARLVVAAAAITLTTASCAGDDRSHAQAGLEPRAWATTFCKTMHEWQLAKARDAVELLPRFQRSTDLRTARASLVELFDRVVGRTDTMLAKLRAMQPPAVENGEEGQRILVDGMAQMKPAFVNAQARAEKLPITSRVALERGFERLKRSYERDLARASHALDPLDALDTSTADTHEMKQAFETPACRTLMGSTG